ncbi:MAG TPA: hypothetical protein VM534_08075, partial [Thermoanaerobaculia bacterium]|nr:hypothetical protein [Thermoanaerobaculia bacterium]
MLLAVGIRPHADELRIALRLEWLVGTTGAVDRGPVRDLRDGLRRRGTIAMKSLPADGTVHRRRNPALRRAATLPSSPPPAELEKSATAARPAETRKLRHATDLGGSRREGGNGGRAAGG